MGIPGNQTVKATAYPTALYKMAQDLVDISGADYLTPITVKTRATHARKFRQFSTSSDSFKFSCLFFFFFFFFFFSDCTFVELCTSFCSCGIFQEGAFHPFILSEFRSPVIYTNSSSGELCCRGLTEMYVLWYRHGRQIGLCSLRQK